MAENTSSFMQALLAYILGVLATLHPWAAVGAMFGCFLFLAMPGNITPKQKMYLSFFSWGVGYALGVMLYGEGPPWKQQAMFVSVAAAALGSVVFTAAYRIIENGGELPPWANAVIDRIPFLNRREP